MGVAEHNMVDAACGLANAGFIPYVYSITTFLVLRAYEAIRNGPSFHQLPLRLIGVGAGLEYAVGGISHLAIDDLAVMRCQPGMTVVAPADAQQAVAALRATHAISQPIFFRLGNDAKTLVPGLDGRFKLGGLELFGEGTDVLLVATGTIVSEALAAAQLLKEASVNATVALVSSFNPSPDDELLKAIRRCRGVVSVEAHYTNGGLGSYVAELIAEGGAQARLVRCGVGALPKRIGSESFLRESFGLSSSAIAKIATQLVRA